MLIWRCFEDTEIADLISFNQRTGAMTWSVSRRSLLGRTAAVLVSVASVTECAPAQPDAQAPSDFKTLSLEALGDVEVTSVAKQPEKILQTPAAVFVIRQQDIRRSGASSIPEALRLAPGVEVARIDANQWSVAIRGFSGQFSKSLLVLVDGRSIYTPLFEGVYWDLPYVMLDDVDRIEVIRGPGGTIWGANAVNGVINIITKRASDTQGSLASLASGTVDQGSGEFRYGGESSGLKYRIYGMGEVRGQEEHPDGNGFDHSRLGQVGFRTDWQRHDKDQFTLQGDVYRGISGESILIPSFSPPAENIENGKDYVSGWNILASWQRKISNRSDIQLQGYIDRTNRQNFELGETRDTFDVDFIHHLTIHSTQELTWGAGARVSPSYFVQTVPGISFLPQRQNDTIYSGFGQYEIQIVPSEVTLTIGTKLEHNNFSGFEYQPSIRLLWSPTERQSVWAAVTRSVRTPSRLDQDVMFDIFDTYFTPSPGAEPIPVYFQIQGNRNLKSEQLVGSELGYRTQLASRLYLDLASFYNLYSGLQGYGPATINEAPLPNPPPAPASQDYIYFGLPYANVIEGHTIGAEIAPTLKVNHWWQLRGSYSYLHMSLRDDPGFSDVGNLLGSYLGSSPGNMASVRSSVDLPKRLELDATYRYSSALPAYAVASYNTADIRLGWGWREGLEFSVLGENLLQSSHAEFGGDPGPLVGIKRSIYGKIVWHRY
jgi:iron complex outermembrane receptor protein